MGKLPLLRPQELMKILVAMGFDLQREQKGSHAFFRHPDGRTTVIPNHPTEHIDRRLLQKIITKDLQITREDFEKYI